MKIIWKQHPNDKGRVAHADIEVFTLSVSEDELIGGFDWMIQTSGGQDILAEGWAPTMEAAQREAVTVLYNISKRTYKCLSGRVEHETMVVKE